jgi:hypothetical protein
MCEYCNRRIHAPGCPNAPEGKQVCRCDYCKDGIVKGEVYVEVEEQIFHRSCFFDYIFSIHEDDLLDLFGLEAVTTGEDE